MAFRLYIVPLVPVPGRDNSAMPKYFGDSQVGGAWSSQSYGFEPWCVVGADLSISDDNFVVGQADGFAIPFDLASQLTALQVTNVQNKLEAINVPAGWIDTSLQWIEVVRVVLGMFQFMQRFFTINGAVLFTGGVVLGTKINQLSQAVRDNLTQAATEMGLSTSGITGTTTIRQALKILADQLSGMQYDFNGVLL